LAQYGFKLGPDPASEVACTLGGVIANNSSGMACGTEFNAYRTIESMVLVLPNGTVIDTRGGDADDRLRLQEPAIHGALLRLRDRVTGNAESVRIIEQQFSLKNTMGYSLNAFIDFVDPVDILTHLLVGSEGTLAFIAEATLRTIPIRPYNATAFLVFETLQHATAALPELIASGLAAVELLDATSLRVAQLDPRSGQSLPGLTVTRHAGLLIEFQEMTAEALESRVEGGRHVLAGLPLATPAVLTTAPQVRNDLWHLRKGLYASVAGSRPSGTTALLEDIAVPASALAGTCEALVDLFDRHRYRESVIFGHAKDGNIHFLLNERFDDPASLERYSAFTEDMVDLVLGSNGTLKAEHGTGRIMAPFVRRQFGDELYDVMRQVKGLLDPCGILNPGVIISDDPSIHLKDLKTTPTVEDEVDRCVECGYCEPVCPSRDLTLTPRQRIVIRREMARARQAGETALVRELEKDYEYAGIDTCAVDGMCATTCPVSIDTGALVKRLRAEQRHPLLDAAWATAARNWAGTTNTAGRVLSAAARLPAAAITPANRLARRFIGPNTMPLWDAALPTGGPRRTPLAAANPVAVYFPACVGTMFGPEPGGGGVQAAFLGLCSRAGIEVDIPKGIDSACCGTPWNSKGMMSGYRVMQARVVPWLWQATDRGRLQIVVDASSCTEGVRTILADVERDFGSRIEVVDAVQFTADVILPRLTIDETIPSLALHPTCSSTHLDLDLALGTIARAIADDVVIPVDWGCCAFAGDRGLLHPELTAAATRPEALALAGREFAVYASCNRTCEIGLTRATGHPYRHLLELLWERVRVPGQESPA
jgi:D-lactate dehydrogenase